MSDQNTPEGVAYQLMKDIFAVEAPASNAAPDRAAILATFAECLRIVRPEVIKAPPAHSRGSF